MKKNMDNESNVNLKRVNFKSRWAITAYVVLSMLLVAIGVYGILYASSPENIRHPSFDHYHFRTQVVVEGEAVDFSSQEFQEDTSTNTTSCSIEINGTPIDFHDNKDQMTHVHWGGVSGGQFLKYYGWNLIGGDDGSLGRRYDLGMMKLHRVNIKGDLLPEIPDNANFYIYIGDESSYEQKNWNDFLNMDLEEFFGKQSIISSNTQGFNILDLFAQKAYAHGTEVDEHDESVDGENDEERLERINNLIGNVVIFVQDSEPTEQQIKERFANLVPLSDSVCGG